VITCTTTYEVALARATQRTAAGIPTVTQRLGDHRWGTRPVAFVSDWPRGKGGKYILTYERAVARAKAATEAGRPSLVERTKDGFYHVRRVPLSSPFIRRDVLTNVRLSEAVVAGARESYKAGRVAMRELARRHDVGYSTIWQAIHGFTWADVS
jgi:hypothetical protein